MSWKKLCLCLAVIAVLAGSFAWAGHHEGEYEELPAAWQAAYNSADAAAVAALYLEDGMRMPPDVPIVKGRDAVQAQIQGGMDQGLAKVKIESVESQVSGEMAWSRGTFATMDADGNPMGSGKWINIAKFVDGKWQTHCDIWNFDAPLPTGD